MPLRVNVKYMSKMILLAVCVLLLMLYLLCDASPSTRSSFSRQVIKRPDSALITIDKTSPRVCVNSKLTPRGDRLTLDTVINHDTLHVSVSPDSTIQIRLLPAPRVVQEWVKYTRRDSVIYQLEVERVFIERAWYESPLLVIAGAVLGFLIAMVL